MRRIVFLLSILLATIGVSAQQTVTVQAQSYQVSDNLDLEAVAITFGESKNVEDFERRLNDPDNRISNLDLNNDGYVDFLRVVEVEEKGTHLLVIQAVIGQDLYQDVASVIVEGENRTTATVTIVGNRDIYGNNYVIVPRYVVRPIIFDWFWAPGYAIYRSLWYWDYYPHYYHHYHCLGYHSYHRHIHTWHTHHHHHCDFHRPTDYHHHHHHVEMHRTVTRNDYATHRPNKGYRAEPAPNSHVEARPTNTTRPSGSLSTSSNNRVGRTTTAKSTQSATTTPVMRRPATSVTTSTSTSRSTNSSTRTVSTSTNRRPTTTSVRTTTTTTARKSTTTTPVRTTTTRTTPKTTTTATRSTTSSTSNRSTATRSTASSTSNRSTATRSTTSSVRTQSTTAVKTDKNMTRRR